jgi:hypothetical protein
MAKVVEGVYKAIFNDKTDPTWVKEDQCIAFLRVCKSCGEKYPSAADKCVHCNRERPRCQNRAMEAEETCRAHARTRSYSIYNKLAGTLSDSVLEEVIEADDRDLSQEYALAKIALSSALDNPGTANSKDIMALVKDFFTIAEKKKNIEKGQVLNIAWNDDLVNTMRLKMRKLIKTFEELLLEFVPDDQLRKQILVELKERTRLIGNSLSVPDRKEDYLPDEEN